MAEPRFTETEERQIIEKNRFSDSMMQLLRKRYPGDLPLFIRERLRTELDYIWNSDREPYVLAYRAVIRAAKKDGQPVCNQGWGSGSLICWLFDQGISPLPPHYECRSCGCVELGQGAALCFDLPLRDCPVCHSPMAREGVPCSAELSFRDHGGLVLQVNSDFLIIACRAALGAMKDSVVYRDDDGCRPKNIIERAFLIDWQNGLFRSLPVNPNDEGADEAWEDHLRNSGVDLLSLSVWADRVKPLPSPALTMEQWMQSPPDADAALRAFQCGALWKDGVAEGGSWYVEQMMEHLRPKTWTEIIESLCYAFGDYNALGFSSFEVQAKRFLTSPYRHALNCREALQDYLREEGVPEILDWQMVEALNHGRRGWEMQVYGEKVPDLEKDELFRAVRFLSSRTQVAEGVWRNLRMNDGICAK